MCRRRTFGCLFAGLGLLVLVLVGACFLVRLVAGPSAACRHAVTGPARSGTSARRLVSGGLERCYLLHVPPGHDLARPAALVFSLHGFASNAKPQVELTGWSELADREDFLVVYPEGTSFPLRWNAAPTFSAADDVDDVQLIREFFNAFVNNARCNLHVEVPWGENNHHIAEAIFKAFARALHNAISITRSDLPSTKGTL